LAALQFVVTVVVLKNNTVFNNDIVNREKSNN
jgi:hypothetical protein